MVETFRKEERLTRPRYSKQEECNSQYQGIVNKAKVIYKAMVNNKTKMVFKVMLLGRQL